MAAPIRRQHVQVLLMICCILCSIYLIHGHSHENGHAHDGIQEPPHHKYSQAANEVNEKEHSHHHGHGHSHDHKSDRHTGPKNVQDNTGYTLWFEAILATMLISAAPVIILVFIPLDNTDEHQPFLKVLLSFASGGLLGDAFLHLIPHAISPHGHGQGEHEHAHSHVEPQHGHSHEHSHNMDVGLWVLAGIVAFLMVEKFVRYVKGGHGHSHTHSQKKETPVTGKKGNPSYLQELQGDSKDTVKESKSNVTGKKGNPGYLKELQEEAKDTVKEAKSNITGKKGNPSYLKQLQEGAKEGKDDVITQESAPSTGKKGNPQYKKELLKESKPTDSGEIKVAGYLNLAADFTHNFTDGLAIGASFLAGRNIGIVTTITILLHEVPHEVGDFAILVQSGYSKRKAMMLQLSTAIGALIGTLCSLGAQHIGDAAVAWIMPFTAGGFIYIATVSVIPELLEDTKPWQSFKEIVALLTGVLMMVLIANFE